MNNPNMKFCSLKVPLAQREWNPALCFSKGYQKGFAIGRQGGQPYQANVPSNAIRQLDSAEVQRRLAEARAREQTLQRQLAEMEANVERAYDEGKADLNNLIEKAYLAGRRRRSSA